ncbi:MAG TPA: flagellar hook-associated protein FlgL [Spongiibacteraceae bacterium]|nr:flagellar hook-associated protein FlgL [Spongiibacteraceae bacterium]
MSERISIAQIFTQGLRGILGAQSQIYKTQNQLSSGKRVLQPSDDPAAAAQILQLNQAQADVTQFKKNITGAQNSLGLEDTQLDNVTTLLTRVRELAVQAGDGALTLSDRKAIATELSQRLDELAGLSNTRSANGEYIFGGFQGQQAPFVQSGTSYVYRGDEGQRYVQISSSTYVPINDSGQSIFVAVPSSRLPTSANAGNGGDGTIAMGQVADQAQFTANFNGPYTISIDTTGPTPTYQVADGGGATVATGNYVSGDPIQFDGAQVDIVGTPANGDSFTVAAPATQDMFTTLDKLITGLNSLSDTATDKQRLNDLISESLDNIDSAENNISTVRAKVGARLNVLDVTSTLQDGVDLANQKVLSQVQDLDYASAISQLNQENLTLQAAQQSFAKISNLSLFNFLS